MCATLDVSGAPVGHDVPAPSFEGLPILITELSAARTMEEVMAVVTRAVRTLLRADGATFVLRDGDRCYYAEEDAISPLWKGQRFPMRACISGWCMMHAQPAAIPDILLDPRIPIDAYRPTFVRSLAMVPVRRDAPIAALGAYWSSVRQIQPREVQLLQAIADSATLSAAYLELKQARPAPGPRRGEVSRPPLARPARGEFRTNPGAARLSMRFRRLMRLGLKANSPQAYAAAVALAAAAVAVDVGLERFAGVRLTPLAVFYPAVVLAAALGGARAGLIAAGLGGLLAVAAPDGGFAALLADGTRRVDLGVYVVAAGLTVAVLQRHRDVIARFMREDTRRISLTREAQHRARNLISMAQVIVRQSLRADPEMARAINERIIASQSHVSFDGEEGRGPADMRGVLAAALASFDLARFSLTGEEEAPLPAELRTILTLTAHELATNATKYGALSGPQGRVTISWRIEGRRRIIRWTESGGPPVEPPIKRGYGSVFLQRLLEGVDGAVTTTYAASGVVVEINLPLTARRGD